MKTKSLKAKYLISAILTILIILLPNNLYLAGLTNNIIPALDLIIIYYLSTYTQTSNVIYFILGLISDKFLNLPLGISSFAFLSANIILLLVDKLMIIKDYITNIAYFVVYCIYIMSVRYLLINIFSDNKVYLFDLVFYTLTTILTYPLIAIILIRIYKSDVR